ncbi:MAG: phosphate propanoyltransferase [bacterium]
MQTIKIEVSARHCHLSRTDLDKLFGFDYTLTQLKPLSQTGQFACQETIAIKTADGELANVRILGPVRKNSQVELSMTEARKLKLQPPVRLSGDLKESAGCTLIGPKGEIVLKEGVIIAKRHIHCDPATAEKLGLQNNQIVSVKTAGERSVTFNEIEVRIDQTFVWAMHVDTDEGNASLPGGVCALGELII